MNLTPKELAVLEAIDDSEYGDMLTDAIWTFSVWDNIAQNVVSKAALPGVIASLNKKGLVYSQDSGRDAVVGMTDAGVTAYLAAKGSSNKPAPKPVVDADQDCQGYKPEASILYRESLDR